MARIKASTSRLLNSAFPALAAIALTTPVHADCVDTNTCVGTGALTQHANGEGNSAFGFRALSEVVDGDLNTAVGAGALSSNAQEILSFPEADQADISGSANTAVGSFALSRNTTGFFNTANGIAALWRNTTGAGNVAVGQHSLQFNTSGSGNVAVGAQALNQNTTGGGNIAIGSGAGWVSGTGSGNVAIGAGVMLQFDENGMVPNGGKAHNNVAIGPQSMLFAPANSENTAVGMSTLASSELTGNTGFGNTGVGARAMENIASGSYNVASGHSALWSIQSGQRNTATGKDALFKNTSGNYNTASGSNALRNLTTGARNVAIGHRAGFNITTGSDNITIGGDNTGAAADSGVIRIGRAANQRKTLIAGIRGVTTGLTNAVPVVIDGNGQLGTIQSSRALKEDIQPMGEVSGRFLKLQPVTFRYKQANDDGTKPVQLGLIAEDVANVFPELAVYDAQGNPESVSYHLLSTLLVNEVQKDRKTIDAQNARIEALETQVAELVTLVRSAMR